MVVSGRSLAISFILLIAFALQGCSQPQSQTGPFRVVATTTIVADLVRQIGGPDVEVVSLMGPGIDPHLYKPSEGDIARMGSAQAVFYNGLHLEGKMTDVLEQMNRRGIPTTAVAECVPEDRLIIAPGFSGVHDPHVWFDVELWRLAAACTRDALLELLPDKSVEIRARSQAYLETLRMLDVAVRNDVALIPADKRMLITAHDAFGYFGRAYGIEVRGLLGISTAAEAGTADVQELADLIAEKKVPAIFVESSVPLRYVQALQQAVQSRGFDVQIGGALYSDALGNAGTPEETFTGTVKHNTATIVRALAGEAVTQSTH